VTTASGQAQNPAVAAAQPELVLGTQMERHIAKRLGLPCAVISAPVHVQDFPARYSPQMGFEGANVLFDTWVHPLMMGLEEHLIGMFRGDSEFHEDAAPSHLGGHGGGLHQPKTTEPELAAAAAQAAPALEPQAAKSEPAAGPLGDTTGVRARGCGAAARRRRSRRW
jgi:light-independent protochlorophyllide reductase subunit B